MTQDPLAPIGVITHYNLLERIDSAGLGELYRARDTRRGRTVGVRLLPADFTDGRADLIERVRAVQTLSHPNAITVFDVGEHDGRVFIVFEFLKGRSLRSEMAGRAVNVRRAIDMTIQIADAVAEAHAAGFVHGGLSPDSVVITAKGNAKIPAFDLAVQSGLEYRDGHARLHDYDSPEEARGQTPDDRSDIYSVGAILYEMLTMRRPLHKGSSAPGASNPHIAKELDAVVLKAVAPNPDLRYQSMASLAGDLRTISTGLELHEVADVERAQAPPATSVGRVLLMTLSILALAGAVLWWVMRS
jgi:serine/threonine protein kinase